jgi:hypothetical protein
MPTAIFSAANLRWLLVIMAIVCALRIGRGILRAWLVRFEWVCSTIILCEVYRDKALGAYYRFTDNELNQD